MILVVRRVVSGLKFDAAAAMSDYGPKSCQNGPWVPYDVAPGRLLGLFWSSRWPQDGAMEPRISSFGTVCTSLWRLRVVFLMICLEKCDCEISMPLCSGIAAFVRLGDQVGATWVQKSLPSDTKSLRTGKSEGPGQSSQTGRCRSYGNCPETVGNQPRTKSSRR